MNTEYRICRCGRPLMVYKIAYERGKKSQVIFFDFSSGNYDQVFICPGCKERLNYDELGGTGA